MTNNTAFALLNYGVGVLVLAISLPLIYGKIPMNAWYGVRIPKAFVSEENWCLINRHGGRWLFIYGILLFLVGTIAAFVPKLTYPYGWLFWVLLFGPIFPLPIPLIAIFRFAKTLPDRN